MMHYWHHIASLRVKCALRRLPETNPIGFEPDSPGDYAGLPNCYNDHFRHHGVLLDAHSAGFTGL